jgi:polyhydroxyalkanoate synthesis regulator phasin
MAGLGDFVQKAFYLGVGIAASASEQASEKISVLRSQAQKLADEMVAKGELTTEEARKLVDDMVKSAQQQNLDRAQESSTAAKSKEPRRIEILEDGNLTATSKPEEDKTSVDAMRRQVEELQAELRKMQQN